MNKTKLGVSTNLLAAFVYALAIVISFVNTSMALILTLTATVAYILLKEDDMWLKSNAVKAVAVIILFMLAHFLVGFADDIMALLNFFLDFADFKLYDKFKIITFIKNILYVTEKIFLLMLSLKAVKGQTVKVPVVDKLISQHIQ